MIAQETIDEAVRRLFSTIEFTREPEGLYDPLRYMVAIGGKRLRPKLCLTVYSLFNDTFGPEILGPAAGLEVFHTFTLIHDDIMDRSPLRRGQETVWKKWSPDTAILSGDVMCIDAYKRIAQAPENVLSDVLNLFSTTAAQVCDGQQYDMDFEKVKAVTMREYLKMIGLKTAVLIACSAKMGALIASAPAEICDGLYNYGYGRSPGSRSARWKRGPRASQRPWRPTWRRKRRSPVSWTSMILSMWPKTPAKPSPASTRRRSPPLRK